MGQPLVAEPNRVPAIDFTFLESAQDGQKLYMVTTAMFSKLT